MYRDENPSLHAENERLRALLKGPPTEFGLHPDDEMHNLAVGFVMLLLAAAVLWGLLFAYFGWVPGLQRSAGVFGVFVLFWVVCFVRRVPVSPRKNS